MPWVALVAATLAVVFVGRAFFANALAAARRGTTDMDTLISLGAGTAYGYSLVAFVGGLMGLWPTPHLYFMEAAGLLALISLGHWLEAQGAGPGRVGDPRARLAHAGRGDARGRHDGAAGRAAGRRPRLGAARRAGAG